LQAFFRVAVTHRHMKRALHRGISLIVNTIPDRIAPCRQRPLFLFCIPAYNISLSLVSNMAMVILALARMPTPGNRHCVKQSARSSHALSMTNTYTATIV
jgi:hypothetical protein